MCPSDKKRLLVALVTNSCLPPPPLQIRLANPSLTIANNVSLPPYKYNLGYSGYYGRTGYNPAINPQIAHIFQSAAMRFGHTIVTPGIWRRELR